MNSLVLSTLSMISALVVSLPTAYSIARWRFGGGLLSIFLLVLRMLPAIALIIPIYIVYKLLGITNNYLALVVIYTVLYIPFSVWLLVGFLRDFPVEIEEAAMIDGCSRLGVLLRIVIPIAAPGLVVAAIFAFLVSWNEFLFALILSGVEAKTLPVVIAGLNTDAGPLYGEMSAAAVMVMLPNIVMTLALQRYLVKGLSLGAVKG
jgi:multiple sugar transport system permease protein